MQKTKYKIFNGENIIRQQHKNIKTLKLTRPPAAEGGAGGGIRLKRKFSWVTANKSVETDVDALLALIKQGFDGSNLMLEGMLEQWFQNLDKDRSGKVDRAEFSEFIKTYTNIEQAAADKIFDHIDGNISGRDASICWRNPIV